LKRPQFKRSLRPFTGYNQARFNRTKEDSHTTKQPFSQYDVSESRNVSAYKMIMNYYTSLDFQQRSFTSGTAPHHALYIRLPCIRRELIDRCQVHSSSDWLHVVHVWAAAHIISTTPEIEIYDPCGALALFTFVLSSFTDIFMHTIVIACRVFARRQRATASADS